MICQQPMYAFDRAKPAVMYNHESPQKFRIWEHLSFVKCTPQREYGEYSDMMCTPASLMVACAVVSGKFPDTSDVEYIQRVTAGLMRLAASVHATMVRLSESKVR